MVFEVALLLYVALAATHVPYLAHPLGIDAFLYPKISAEEALHKHPLQTRQSHFVIECFDVRLCAVSRHRIEL